MTTLGNKEATASRVLTNKWREVEMLNHYARITQSKSSVACHNTNNFPHLTTKPKTKKLAEGK